MTLLTILLAGRLLAAEPPVHCATPLFEPLKQGQTRPLQSLAPKAAPRLNDQRLFWLFNMAVMPPVQMQLTATCRGVGNHCYVWVEDSSWNAGQMDSTDVAFIIERFDHSSPRDSARGVWQHNTGSLGMPPDIDQDSLIHLMYYDVAGFHGYTFDGFWMYFDEYPDSIAWPRWGYHSNECEIVYLDNFPNDPGTDYRVAIAAHEFAHMIHYNYDQVESLWVNEGCAELAMWLYGSPDRISGFNSAPDDDLTLWNGQWTDYIQTYLFFLYLYEQHGERVGRPLIKSIVANPWVSIAGIDSTLAQLGVAERFTDIFHDWVIANYLDDTLAFDGRYGYYGERLPAFFTTNLTIYPVNAQNSLKRWAGEYFRFIRGSNLTLGFAGADYARFRAMVLMRDSSNHVWAIDSIRLDSLQAGSINIPGFGTTYQSVYLIPSNATPEGGTESYRFTATASGVEENPEGLPATADLRVSARPNLLLVSYSSPVAGPARLSLHDVQGRQALNLDITVRAGSNDFLIDVRAVPAGTCFLGVVQSGRRATFRTTIVR